MVIVACLSASSTSPVNIRLHTHTFDKVLDVRSEVCIASPLTVIKRLRFRSSSDNFPVSPFFSCMFAIWLDRLFVNLNPTGQMLLVGQYKLKTQLRTVDLCEIVPLMFFNEVANLISFNQPSLELFMFSSSMWCLYILNFMYHYNGFYFFLLLLSKFASAYHIVLLACLSRIYQL
ncbi:hypothetical protein Hanom_Chr16g01442421 [Helianthus anomalus]